MGPRKRTGLKLWRAHGSAKWTRVRPGRTAVSAVGGNSDRFHSGCCSVQRGRIMGARSCNMVDDRDRARNPGGRLAHGVAAKQAASPVGADANCGGGVPFGPGILEHAYSLRSDWAGGGPRTIRCADVVESPENAGAGAQRGISGRIQAAISPGTRGEPDRLFLPPCGAIGRRGAPVSSRDLGLHRIGYGAERMDVRERARDRELWSRDRGNNRWPWAPRLHSRSRRSPEHCLR